jgi:hypothetical protein
VARPAPRLRCRRRPRRPSRDFGDARFTYEGVTTRFYRKDGKPFVRTDGPDGRLADYPVAYVFGVAPLQQYLVELPGGRFQALSVAWDSRPRAKGGQRWFHLYPGERVDHRDVLHWTNPSQGWNTQCAECHSTNLRKGYRFAEDRFETTFAEIDVSCEACHGPGSRHAEWAERAKAWGMTPRGEPGLIVRFTERRSREWEMDRERGIARPTKFLETRFEVETCALPRAARPADGRLQARPAAGPDAPAVARRRGPLLRGRADAGRGVQLGLVPPEPDVRDGRHVLRLPRPPR